MRKYIILYLIAATLVSVSFRHTHAGNGTSLYNETDTVAVNTIVKETTLHWNDWSELTQSDFRYDFFILDSKGDVKLQTRETLPDNLQSALRQGFLPMDIHMDGKDVGRVLIETLPQKEIILAGERLTRSAFLAFLLLNILNILFFIMLYAAVIRPFQKLQGFAHKISTGNLDEPLPVGRRNAFGLFTQSFDVMRESLRDERQSRLAAERSKKELTASLSHDIKTPVTAIRMTAELLEAISTEPAVTEKLRTIEAKADQINRLMRDLLHSSLEDLGELKVTPTSEDSMILSGLLRNADPYGKVTPGTIPSCLIEIDIARMEQIIGNIISNSYKYAGTDIDTRFQIEGNLLRMDIKDYGRGVEPEALELITTQFYRGENAKLMQKEGEGLGLYIAKLLMGKMGGGLEAQNCDEGFTIRLWIPLSK